MQSRQAGLPFDSHIHSRYNAIFWAARYPYRKIHNRLLVLITGMSAEKDIQGMIEAWLLRTIHIIATQSGHPRAIPPEELAEEIRLLTDVPVASEPNAAASLESALEIVTDDQLILATGSVFEVASVRVAWMERQKIGA